MADLLLLGKVSREEHPFFKSDYWFYIERVDQGGEEDAVSFNNGTNMLENTIAMWDLIDPEKRKEYYDLRKKIEQENKLESGGYLVTVQQVKQFLEILNDLDVKLKKFLDSNGRVKEEYVDFISRVKPTQTFDDDSFNYDGIRGEISDIEMMKHFLNQAIELNYPLAIG